MLRIDLRIEKRLERWRQPPAQRNAFVLHLLLRFPPDMSSASLFLCGIIGAGVWLDGFQKEAFLRLRADIHLRHVAHAADELLGSVWKFENCFVASSDTGGVDGQNIGQCSERAEIGLIRDLRSIARVAVNTATFAVLEPVWLA